MQKQSKNVQIRTRLYIGVYPDVHDRISAYIPPAINVYSFDDASFLETSPPSTPEEPEEEVTVTFLPTISPDWNGECDIEL